MAALLKDLRYALRALGSHAGSTLIIVASLAIGIGANTAIFSARRASIPRWQCAWIDNPPRLAFAVTSVAPFDTRIERVILHWHV